MEESAREIEVDAAEIVLAGAADAESLRAGGGTLAVRHTEFSPA
jgi:hypothetical protein